MTMRFPQLDRPTPAKVVAPYSPSPWMTSPLRSAVARLALRRLPVDLPTLAAVIALLLAAGFGAIILPARRATRVDPARTLMEG